MPKVSDFAADVKCALIRNGKSNGWLISEVSKRTNLYFDRSYYSKVLRGKVTNEKIVNAIKEIIGELT